GAFLSSLPVPVTRSVAAMSLPFSFEIICWIGPPGAACTMKKLTTMIASSVGIISRMRRIASAIIVVTRRTSLVLPAFAGTTLQARSRLYLALLRFDRLLGFRVDPPGVETKAVFRRNFRPPELVPGGHPERGVMKIRDYVIAVLQDPIERVGVRDQAGAVGGADQLLDQLVDDRALDPDQVAAAVLVGRFRTPEFALFVARRQRLAEHHDRHVVIEGLHPLFVLRGVDRAHMRADTHAFQVLGE